MSKVPLIFLSDSPSSTSGLGRITRDLAVRVQQHLGDLYDVCCVGYGGAGDKDLPVKEYHLHNIDKWLVSELPAIYENWCHGREGVIFCIWDMSRLYWLGAPDSCPIPQLRRWAENPKMKKWAYHAVDAEGPNGRWPARLAEIAKGFDRLLDYSAFSSKITGNPEHIGHGIDTSVFYPRDHNESRASLVNSGFRDLTSDSLLIGIVSTNQARKNWQLGMETSKILLDRGYDVRIWAHTDMLERYWSMTNLVVDYGLVGRCAVTLSRFTDDIMALMYSACNVTLGIGPEGFGYPIAESLACGVPCIVGTYGAQREFTPPHMQVAPVAYNYEGVYCSKRPVHDASLWADRVEAVKREASIPEGIDWNGSILWPQWERWFREGL